MIFFEFGQSNCEMVGPKKELGAPISTSLTALCTDTHTIIAQPNGLSKRGRL